MANATVATPTHLDDTLLPTPPTPKRWSQRVLGVIAVCGVVCAAVGAYYEFGPKPANDAISIVTQIQQSPGLKVVVNAKRASMAFNGQLSTTVYVVPRTGSGANLKFDAFLSQPGPNVTANYMLLDDRAYWSIEKDAVITSAGCLDADQLPPVQLMQASLTDAVVVSSVDDQKIECPSGKLLQLQFAGEKFVFCNSNTNQLTKAVGADVDMTIEYLADPTMLPDFTIPRVPGQSALSCPVITNAVFPNLRRSPTTTLSTHAALLGPTTCRCKGRRKPCLFVHGVGNNESSPPTRTFPETWGSIQDHAPCCSSVAFAHYESRARGWTRRDVQVEFCTTARHVSGSSTSSIDNLILVTYSMGNLVAGGAVANRTCTFGSGVTWVSLAGPMQGSNASNVLEQKCAAGDWSPSLAVVGYCPATEAYLQLKDQTTVSTDLYNAFQAAQSVRHRANKVLCGINASGLGSADAPALVYVGSQAFSDGTLHDGVVDLDSCSFGFSKFATDAMAGTNYKASINHFDASFRNGDGWWGADRKPVKWFECAL